MNFLFAPNESRAQNFLKDNHFGLDDRTVVRLDYHGTDGMRFYDEDVIYLLDGLSERALDTLQRNIAIGKTQPRVISVEER